MKLSFKDQLRWAGYGIAGFLIPALALQAASGKWSSVVVASAALTSVMAGVLMGNELRDQSDKSTIAILSKSLEDRINDNSMLHSGFAKLTNTIRDGDYKISELKNEIDALKNQKETEEFDSNVAGWVIKKPSSVLDSNIYLGFGKDGLATWYDNQTKATRFATKTSATNFLNHYQPRFTFIRTAEIVKYTKGKS